MQAQQLYNELRKVKHELDSKREEVEDVREELREMTQMYLITKQERDKLRFQIGSVKKDLDNIGKIIQDNVDKAVKNKEKQILDLQQQSKEQQEKIKETENHKKCYLDTINYLEDLLRKVQEDLEKERNLNQQLIETNQTNALKQSQNNLRNSNQFGQGILNEERIKMKQLQAEDDIFTFEQKVIRKGQKPTDQRMLEKDLPTFEDDNEEEITSYDEPTNCRLQQMNDPDLTGALFGNNLNGLKSGPAAIVRLDEVKLQMSSGSKDNVLVKSKNGNTPAKIMPFDDTV